MIKREIIIAPTSAVPDCVVVRRKESSQTWTFVKRERPAKAIVRTNGATGHARCGACKKSIDQGDRFCRHCGRSIAWVR